MRATPLPPASARPVCQHTHCLTRTRAGRLPLHHLRASPLHAAALPHAPCAPAAPPSFAPELRRALRSKDDEYVKLLKRQAAEVDTLLVRAPGGRRGARGEGGRGEAAVPAGPPWAAALCPGCRAPAAVRAAPLRARHPSQVSSRTDYPTNSPTRPRTHP